MQGDLEKAELLYKKILIKKEEGIDYNDNAIYYVSKLEELVDQYRNTGNPSKANLLLQEVEAMKDVDEKKKIQEESHISRTEYSPGKQGIKL